MSTALLERPGCSNYAFLGEAGCGKSEAAINLALHLARTGEKPVHFFDLDMTKPLFRSRDQAHLLEKAGVCVHYEEQFMDAPTMTGGVVRLLRDNTANVVLDVGGDSIGARAVGGYAPWLNREDTALYYLLNPYRPWSATLERIDTVLGETLGVSHLELDRLHLVGNPNLGPETTPEDVLQGWNALRRMVEPYKPVEFLCVREELEEPLSGAAACPILPLRLYMTYPWLESRVK